MQDIPVCVEDTIQVFVSLIAIGGSMFAWTGLKGVIKSFYHVVAFRVVGVMIQGFEEDSMCCVYTHECIRLKIYYACAYLLHLLRNISITSS